MNSGYKRCIIGGAMCFIGVILTAEFLINDQWMRDSSYYDKETGMLIYKLNIGFHWTTLIGMLGVVLLVLGARKILEIEQYIIGAAAFTVCIINFCSWKFFLSMSEIYYEKEVSFGERIIQFYYILKLLSIIFAVALLIIMLWKMDEKKVTLSYRILAILVVASALGCIMIKTIYNSWYLLQTALAGLTVGIVCGSKRMYCYIKKKKRRKGWRVL